MVSSIISLGKGKLKTPETTMMNEASKSDLLSVSQRSATSSRNGLGGNQQIVNARLAATEQKAVFWSKVVVVVVLVLAVTTMALGTYYITEAQEYNEFKNQVRFSNTLICLLLWKLTST